MRTAAVVFSLALALAIPSVAHAAGVTPAQATPVQREQAQNRFVRGRDLFNAKKFDKALVEFSASLDIVVSPNTRLYVGRAQREMGHLVAAYVEFGRAAVEAKELARDDPRYDKAGAAALEERNALEPKLGFVDIGVSHASDATTLKVGGDEVRRGGWNEPVPIFPGTADVLLETPGHAPITTTVQVAAGEHKRVDLDAGIDAPEPPAPVATAPEIQEKPAPTALRPLAYVAGGVAIVGFLTFVTAGALSNGTYSSLKDECSNAPCPPGHESEISKGRTEQTLANVGLVVFGVAAAAGVTLFVISRPSAPSAQPTTTPQTTARVTAGPSFVGLTGSF